MSTCVCRAVQSIQILNCVGGRLQQDVYINRELTDRVEGRIDFTHQVKREQGHPIPTFEEGSAKFLLEPTKVT